MNVPRFFSFRAGFSGLVACALPAALLGVQRPPVVSQKHPGSPIVYKADAQGDRVPDFSEAGYGGGGVALPDVPSRVRVNPVSGDAGARIQAAIDYVSSLPADAHGIRGAVELAAGRFEIAGQLRISTSGVVLRGAGSGPDGTVLVATGTRRRALVWIHGSASRVESKATRVTDERVPVGATTVDVADASGIRTGSEIEIARPATKAWLHAIGMDVAPARQQFIWRVPAMGLSWDRTVVAVDGRRLTLDAPMTTALEQRFGGATVAVVTWKDRLSNVGVENLRCESDFDASNPLDEQHSWEAVDLDAVRDAWVAGVTAVHFAGSAVNIGSDASRVTVEDCAFLAPVSEIGGYRRNAFHTDGQQTLFLRCHSEDAINDFTVGYKAGGPNVFLGCTALRSHGFSGSIGSWASGVLFDNVTLDGGTLELTNKETWNQGVGWAAVNSMLWQCTAPVVVCRQPPTAENWADGVWGQFVGDGWWSEVNETIHPDSLYEAQLGARAGTSSLAALQPRPVVKSSAPDLAQALPNLAEVLAPKPAPAGRPLELTGGWLAARGALLTGTESPLSWWRGYMLAGNEATPPDITRFAPGKTGPIFTDDLNQMTDTMVAKHQVDIRHHYGLWYDRRRMDHEQMRRPDGNVWPPFYEQPFARTGIGKAWDGLSRYDLTKYNPWYFGRLHQFAEQARRKGLVLINEMYFQHNLLEAGAHWVDCPWRPTNNINHTPFPEPVHVADHDLQIAPYFYDVSNPQLRALHRAYIRHCLENLADEPNVIHTISAENTGPLKFMRFWLDVVAEWEHETGKHPLIALSACKDVQDAILADPKRAAVVDVIDFTYWWRTDNGREFAPPGGVHVAPRQYERKWRGGRATASSLAGMVREYRSRFPGKAIITGLDAPHDWAYVAAGGSLPALPATTDPALLSSITRMGLAASAGGDRQWALSEPGKAWFAVSLDGPVSLDLRSETGSFRVRRIDPRSGRVIPGDESVDAGRVVSIAPSPGRITIVWLTR